MTISRRTFLGGMAGVAAASATAGCSGFTGKSSEKQGSSGTDTLALTLWGGDAEIAGFKAVADAFQKKEGVTVKLRNVPFAEVLTTVDAGLQSGTAPDLFRVTFTDAGAYAAKDVLLDITDRLPDGYLSGFTPAFQSSVKYQDKVFGVPHHTDTSVVLYDPAKLAAAGVKKAPTSYDEAWTWEEFHDVATRLKKRAKSNQWAVGVNWQKFGAFRWLNWLGQADGRLLGTDLKSAAIPSAQAQKALKFTQSLFTEGLVPPTTSTKGRYVDEIFPSETIAMVFAGDFLLSSFESTVKKFKYAATFLPRDEKATAELGGNAVVATKSTKNPEAAAKFLAFLASEEQMANFCQANSVLPTRTALINGDLKYSVRPDLMPLFVQQAKAITPEIVQQVTVPQFNGINGALVERLERAFVNKQDSGKVLDGLASDLDRLLKS